MTIHWASLLDVFLVSFGTTVAIVVLVSVATVGLSARVAPARRPLFSPGAGAAVALASSGAAALIVMFGLWMIVAR
jgi:hypothetical protein